MTGRAAADGRQVGPQRHRAGKLTFEDPAVLPHIYPLVLPGKMPISQVNIDKYCGKETLLANNSNNSKGVHDRAEATFKKEQRAREGAKAMADYEAAGVATREKTARLKALRLAKEAAELNLEKKPV